MLTRETLLKSCQFKAVRSSGSGGQHVNKVSTKAELSFNINTATCLTEFQKAKLKSVLEAKLTNEGILVMTCQETRSQLRNKEIALTKLLRLINSVFVKTKKRIPTKIPKSVKIKRLKNKRFNSERKSNRRKPNLD